MIAGDWISVLYMTLSRPFLRMELIVGLMLPVFPSNFVFGSTMMGARVVFFLMNGEPHPFGSGLNVSPVWTILSTLAVSCSDYCP